MTKLRKKIDDVLERALALIFSLMVINVLWQVCSRYVFGTPSSFTDELARFLLIWLGILGAAYVSGRNTHVAIDILPSWVNQKNQRRLKRIVLILVVAFCFFAFVIGGSRLVYLTYILNQYSPSLKLPMAIVYAVLPISGVLIIYYKLSDFLKK